MVEEFEMLAKLHYFIDHSYVSRLIFKTANWCDPGSSKKIRAALNTYIHRCRAENKMNSEIAPAVQALNIIINWQKENLK